MNKSVFIVAAVFLLTAFTPNREKNISNQKVPFQSNKVMIVLQENTGKLDVLPENTPKEFKKFFTMAVDRFAESFEDIKSDLQGSTRYKKVIFLSDVNCTRAKLLTTLINETVSGNEIDLFCFGHGDFDKLLLHNNELLVGGPDRSLRRLLTDARAQKGAAFNFNLRLVYMCECIGSTLNDDWLAIGAKVSVGSKCLNFMAEPMITLFIHKYLLENKNVATAAAESFNEAKFAWSAANAVFPQLGYNTPIPEYGCSPKEDKYETSRPIVAGNGNIKFNPNSTSIGAINPSNVTWRTIGDLTGTTADDELAEGTYYIKSAASTTNKYLDVSGSCLNENLCKIQLYDLGQSTQNNKWVVKKINGLLGGYTLKCVANNKYMDADILSSATNGCKVNTANRISELLPRTNQEWKIVARGNGLYTIKCIMSGLYLDAVNDCVNENNCKVQLWEDYGHISKKWKFVKVN